MQHIVSDGTLFCSTLTVSDGGWYILCQVVHIVSSGTHCVKWYTLCVMWNALCHVERIVSDEHIMSGVRWNNYTLLYHIVSGGTHVCTL